MIYRTELSPTAVRRILHTTGGNISKTARKCGVHVNTLRRFLEEDAPELIPYREEILAETGRLRAVNKMRAAAQNARDHLQEQSRSNGSKDFRYTAKKPTQQDDAPQPPSVDVSLALCRFAGGNIPPAVQRSLAKVALRLYNADKTDTPARVHQKLHRLRCQIITQWAADVCKETYAE